MTSSPKGRENRGYPEVVEVSGPEDAGESKEIHIEDSVLDDRVMEALEANSQDGRSADV